MPTIAITVYNTIPATTSADEPGENGSGETVRRMDHSSSATANNPEMIRGGLADRFMALREPYRAQSARPSAMADGLFGLALLITAFLARLR
jgi:hypothetical protein